MATAPCDGQNNPPALPLIFVEMPPPLACLHCAATQASVRRDRQIQATRLGYPADCVCCDCETGHACPQCLGENLEYGRYDYGTDPETGYAHNGERYYCRDCGAVCDVDDTVPALVMLPQPSRKPMVSADLPADWPEVA
jgi:uncharacterized protein YbaR (Trm112 family)